MFKEVMLDLETLGTGPDAAIASVGAVKFNLEDVDTEVSLRDPSRTFYAVINIRDSFKYGKADADTVRWWLNQSEEAREIFKLGRQTEYLRTVFHFFNDYMCGAERNLWANGSSFDCIVLESAYKAQSFEPAWRFNVHRDMRTIKDLAKRINPKVDNDIKIGTYHNALDDAIKQALLVQRYYRVIRNQTIEGDLRNV